MLESISACTEENNYLSHFNKKITANDFSQTLLECKHSLSWENYNKSLDMNFDNKNNNKFLEGLSDAERHYYLDNDYNRIINEKNNFLNQYSNDLKEVQEEGNSSEVDSLSDLFNNVKQSLILGKNDYLDVLKDVFSNYMNFVNELRQILSNLDKYYNKKEKENQQEGMVDFDFKAFYIDLSKIIDKYKTPLGTVDDPFVFQSRLFFQHQKDGTYLRTIDGQEVHYSDKQQVNNAVDTLEKLLRGIKGIEITRQNSWSEHDVDVDCRAKIDCTDLETLLKDLSEKVSNEKEISLNNFNLFKNTVDALDKKINTNLDELSKKYSTANSNYDNFVKIVSSTMNTLLEMAKGFLRS
ncbi:IpaD/SipD/SspD family type III secretion system needle tip protein [Proteus mirabilis]|uniref:IpaD/SipD/SspD family type III secretion system needle tip protein n=1 Tax=Proteus mirabilis TaxID=584 RepID=UPI0018C746FA|nr:IpaD/SipD/SspD family type III secretion system needle tip protein [Proteus mirabilis]